MNVREEVKFSRNAEAVMIPSGERVLVPNGSEATITQSLGGSYTLITDRGLMIRVSGREVEAIGKTPENVPDVAPGEALTPEKLEELVWEQLKTCFDPEIPVNIVDLGLIYEIKIQPERVDVKMTLTALGCPMAGEVMTDVRDHLLTLPGVKDAGVELVYDPPWTPERMTEEARWELGMV